MTPVPATIARLVPMTAMHTQNITAVNIRGRLTAITADATTVVVGTGTANHDEVRSAIPPT